MYQNILFPPATESPEEVTAEHVTSDVSNKTYVIRWSLGNTTADSLTVFWCWGFFNRSTPVVCKVSEKREHVSDHMPEASKIATNVTRPRLPASANTLTHVIFWDTACLMQSNKQNKTAIHHSC